MPKVRLYRSEKYLYRQYVVLKKTPEQIAAEQQVTKKVIYTWLRKFGLLR